MNSMMVTEPNARFAAFILVAVSFLMSVNFGLLVPVYAGLLAFCLVSRFTETIVDERIRSSRSKWIATTLVTVLVVLALVGTGAAIHLLLSDIL